MFKKSLKSFTILIAKDKKTKTLHLRDKFALKNFFFLNICKISPGIPLYNLKFIDK